MKPIIAKWEHSKKPLIQGSGGLKSAGSSSGGAKSNDEIQKYE